MSLCSLITCSDSSRGIDLAGVVDSLSNVDAFGDKVVRRAGIFERGVDADLESTDPGKGGAGS